MGCAKCGRGKKSKTGDVANGVAVRFLGNHPGAVWYKSKYRSYSFSAYDNIRRVHKKDVAKLVESDMFEEVK